MSDPDGRIYHVLTALLVAGVALACKLYGGPALAGAVQLQKLCGSTAKSYPKHS
ncbi:hypothetical protein Deipr_0341 [Deinococcus proteolyticus MRP]|uniref:Uncharacterized protein n=1 Tax=Deinococcus proteolyticus (strain ATCC 35074 / DSM 20540 / JCM 6276 / NBRC 101906 / NCIMB 13154 / VKM Ac-1939 / CCM 2703 / MRP) TaxID=693977 RepID=F0RJH0_DEIPM|nr:hypothetical protein Deipr_0341 [Deinococcus proteolyticus MRP]